MKSLFASNRQLLITTLGGIVFVILGGGFLFLVPREPARPEAFLPASNVVAFFSKVPSQQLRKFTAFSPLLAALPPTDFPAVAVVKTNNGEGLAIFSERADGADQDDLRLGSYAVSTSSQEIVTMLRDFQENPSTGALDRSESFAAFAEHLAETPWVFMESNRFPFTGTLTDQIAKAFFMHSSRLALAFPREESISILLEHDRSDGAAIHGSLRTPFESPTFVLRASNIARLFEMFTENLSDDSRGIANALLTGHAQAFFGPETSVTYDLLPLLEREATVSWTEESGGWRFTLEGSQSDEAALREQLRTLFVRARADLPQSTTEEHTFDNRFRMNLLKQSDEAMEETQETIGNWAVSSIQAEKTGRGFLTAQRGKRFIMSNDPEIATDFIKTGSGYAISTGAPRVMERGWKIAEGLFPQTQTPIGTLRSFLPSSGISLHWSIEQTRNLTAITLQ